MARDGQRQKVSSAQAQTSKTSQDKVSHDPSLSQIELEKIKKADEYLDLHYLINKLYPNGHPDFNDLMLQQMALHSKKNKEYAHSGPPLGNFDRVACIMYLMKHLDAVLWAYHNGKLPNDENLADISVYINIIRCMINPQTTQQANTTK